VKVGAHIRRKAPGIFCRAPFFGYISTVVLVSAFVMISSLQFGHFLVCYSSTHVATPCPAILKTGARALCPMESAPLKIIIENQEKN